jgi:N-acylglucosamine 2-epimerase
MANEGSRPLVVTPAGREELMRVYRDGLLGDTLPFWIDHCVDREYGGFMFCLDRDGTVIDTDKGMWTQGRFTWLLGTLYSEVEPRAEWLELARHGIDFIRRFGFDDDGRMFFHVTRDGRPVRKRRYLFTETFAVAALAAYARATGDEGARQEAVDLFKLVVRYLTTPGLIPPKINPEVRAMKGLAMPMIMIVTAQILRQATDDPICDEWIDRSINEIERDFTKPEFEAVMATLSKPPGSSWRKLSTGGAMRG